MNKMREIREFLGFTQKEISDLLNISQCAYSQYELGNRSPSIKVSYKLIKLASLSGMKLTLELIKPE